jgi:hypothetical protein
MEYRPKIAKEDKQKMFEGALPTTIYQTGYSEVYGLNPDIDSTALMINTTSWILGKLLRQDRNQSSSEKFPSSYLSSSISTSAPVHNATSDNWSITHSMVLPAVSMTNYSEVINFVVPRMLKAVNYLLTRDIDNDGLLEQNHNEDWMDTALRAGKIVYSQACWILALNNLSYLLSELGNNDYSERIMKITYMTMTAVEKNCGQRMMVLI